MRHLRPAVLIGAAAVLATADPAAAASLDGSRLGLVWAAPFVGILLSIALLPQLAPHFWEHKLGLIAAFWAGFTLIPLALSEGATLAGGAALHVLLTEYLPFVLLLFALYTIAGGIVVAGNLHGSPAVNTALLAFGTAIASLVGTTGASMILIRPLIRANDDRRHRAHTVIFFIFLVSNIGGALTPLGDPPLFLGFLRGVDFFWTTRFLLWPTLFAAALLLALFFCLDTWLYRQEQPEPRPDPTPDERLHLRGGVNFALLALLVGAILLSGVWKPGTGLTLAGVRLETQDLVRDGAFLALALASLRLSAKRDRIANDFTWAPIREVALIFAGIFICIIPVSAGLAAGANGPFAGLLALVSRPDGSPDPASYFWLTGILSSFLDNAPTYLVFFDLAGGDAARLMGPLSATLTAISAGAVFMGAVTYIGNAPNFMVYAIARGQKVPMPGFLGYMAWSGLILLPTFGLVTLLFFR